MPEIELAAKPESWVDVGEHLAAGVAKSLSLDALSEMIANAIVTALMTSMRAVGERLPQIGAFAGQLLVDAEEPLLPLFAGFVAPIVANLFGTEASNEAFSHRANREGRGDAARQIVESFMSSVTGDAEGDATPGDEGAKRIAGAAVHAAIEGWFNELIPEMLGELVPIDWLHFNAFTGLSEEVISALGVSRLVRRAFAPLVDATAATPMKWAVAKRYRTTLLAPSTVIRQFTRGRWDWEDVVEELARQGYSDERIDALISEQMKFHGVADLAVLMHAGQVTHSQAVDHLKAQGYTDDVAGVELLVEDIKRIRSFEQSLADAAMTAFADGRIDDATLGDYTHGATFNSEDGNRLRELAHARRALRAAPLTSGEAKTAVKAGILAVADYRIALEREGRTPDAVDVLELLLRKELDDKTHVDELRAQQQAEQQATRDARALAAAKREQDVEAQRALSRRGSLGDLKRAVITGLIPISRYDEVLEAEYDGDTVRILTSQVELDRAAYVAEQQKRDDAAKRATGKNLNVGQLEQAVFEGVLSLDEFRGQLTHSGLSAGDVDVLARTVAAKKNDLDIAKAKRADADKRAAAKSIDLGRFEQLVRAGVRTLAQYDTLLSSLGYDDASRAGMRQLLTIKMAADATASGLRKGITTARPSKGLSLDQARRAVILGLSSLDTFQRFLVTEGYTTDAQIILVDELRDDVEAADAARQRRSSSGGAPGPRVLPIGTITKAASLGFISPDAYEARLLEEGYNEDDVALEMMLLQTEISAVQSARRTQTSTAAPAGDKGLSLTQLADAVKHGAAPLEQYRARAVEFGLGKADVDTLVRVLGDELEATTAAKARRAQIAGDLSGKAFALATVEEEVIAGTRTIESYEALLTSKGYAADDVELLAELLIDRLAGGPPASA